MNDNEKGRRKTKKLLNSNVRQFFMSFLLLLSSLSLLWLLESANIFCIIHVFETVDSSDEKCAACVQEWKGVEFEVATIWS